MSTISLRISDTLHQRATELASRDEVSLNQFISLAVAEKVSALGAVDILAERAKRGDKAKFLAVLDKAPDGDETQPPKATVESVLAGLSKPVRGFVEKLRPLLKMPDCVEKATNTNGGDIRYAHKNGLYAEFKFCKRLPKIVLRLYFPPDFSPPKGFKQHGDITTGKSVYDLHLSTKSPIDGTLRKWIELSKDFVRNKR